MKKSVPPQFNYGHLRSKDYDKNSGKPTEHQSCIICGKPMANPKYFVWEHCGGGTVVTHEEGERLNDSGKEGSDLGMQPIGSDCLKNHPILKSYIESLDAQR